MTTLNITAAEVSAEAVRETGWLDRKSTRLNSSHWE